MKVSDLIVKELEKHTDHVFCLVGGGSMHLNDSLYDSKLTPVYMLHEQSCAFAAQAYAHMTNKLGVCMVTSGPGATNAITGCLAAWMDSDPVLFISGNVPTQHSIGDSGRRYVGPQECDIISMVKGITKYATKLQFPSWDEGITIMEMVDWILHDAIGIAQAERKGPVWLDVPLDIQGAEIE